MQCDTAIRELSLLIGGGGLLESGGGPCFNKFIFREGHIFKKGDLEMAHSFKTNVL